MTWPVDPEYRRLATESSNDIIRWDTRSGVGEYPEAALHARQAGLARARMGQIALDAGLPVRAASDWLSAAACFYWANSPEGMRACLERVRQLDQAGQIPADRRDLVSALREREDQILDLHQRLAAFEAAYEGLRGIGGSPRPFPLEFLTTQVRTLPGYAKLHALIAHEANLLGQLGVATEHLNWAETFNPGELQHVMLRMDILRAAGETGRAVAIGRAALAARPDADFLRVPLAQMMVAGPDAQAGELEESVQLLRPVVVDDAADLTVRLGAVGLSAVIYYELGREAEYHDLLSRFDLLAETVRSDPGLELVARVRQVLPQVFPRPGMNGNGKVSAVADRSAFRRQFFELLHPAAVA